MQTNPESAAVEAVAWLVTNGGECCEPWLVYERSEVEALPASCIADPLYPQSALDALRGECVRIERENREGWKQAAHHRQRADAAERRVEELVESLTRTRDAIAAVPEHTFGVHYEGDDRPSWPIRDEFLHSIDSALTKVTP